MPTLNTILSQRLNALDAQHLRRSLRGGDAGGVDMMRGGKALISFAGNDYLGLRQHPNVLEAARAALDSSGAGASRLVSGNHAHYAALEAEIASMKHTEAALVFGSGYATSIGVIPALVGKGDLIVADKLIHACMLDGAKLSGATLLRFAHNDMAHLENLLREHRASYANCLIATEHIFSMDGDIAPLENISALAKTHDAWLMVDDAHGLGVVRAKPIPDWLRDAQMEGNYLWMGTLSKAAGSYGGYVAGSTLLVDGLVNLARSFIFSTGLPPSVVAASTAALHVMRTEPRHHARLWHNIGFFADAMKMPTPQSAIIPIPIGDAQRAVAISDALCEQGFYVPAIRTPTVPKGTERLRVSISALHHEAALASLAKHLQELLA